MKVHKGPLVVDNTKKHNQLDINKVEIIYPGHTKITQKQRDFLMEHIDEVGFFYQGSLDDLTKTEASKIIACIISDN